MPASAKKIILSHQSSAIPSYSIFILSHLFCVVPPNVSFPVSLPMSVCTNRLVLFSYTKNCLKNKLGHMAFYLCVFRVRSKYSRTQMHPLILLKKMNTGTICVLHRADGASFSCLPSGLYRCLSVCVESKDSACLPFMTPSALHLFQTLQTSH